MSPGRTSAITRSGAMPTARATASAVVRASPVSSHTSTPAARSSRDRLGRRRSHRVGDRDQAGGGAVDGDEHHGPAVAPRRSSPGRRAPRGRRPARSSAAGCRPRPPARRPSRGRRVRRWPRTRRPPGSRARPRVARRTIASPRGCSDRVSSEAARSSSSGGVSPEAGTTAATSGRPSVSVPVLSKTTVSTRPAVSSASPPRTRIPASAPCPVPTMIAVGVARPMAHGQAMITTPMKAVRASVKPRLRADQHPGDERQRRDHEDQRHEHLADPVGEPLDRRLGALGALDQLDDPREGGLAAHARRAHHERAASC